MSRGPDDFFFSLTLNDFVLTLLFLILLLCLWSLKMKASDLEECKTSVAHCDEQHVRALEEEVALIRAILEGSGKHPEEIERLVLVALKDARRIQSLEKENRDLERETEDLRRQLRVAAPLDAAGEPIDIARVAEENREMKERLKGCVSEMRKCGLGMPACWPDPITQKPQYIFNVTILEDGLSVAPAWPTSREADARLIPGALKLAGEKLSLEEFSRRASPILAWSKQKECRHYVHITDQALTKAAFKRQLLGVEDYFYKFLERRGRADQ